MNEQSILCFLSTSKTQSFSTTAREMMISQQAVSRYIQKLEEELGITLFIRDQNFVTLTSAGRQFYRYLQEYSSQFYELQSNIQAPDYTLRIGISDWIGNGARIRKSAQNLKKKHPQSSVIYYVISVKQADEMIQENELDCYLTTNYELGFIRSICEKREIVTDRICLASAKSGSIDRHLLTFTGEPDEITLKARDMRIFHTLGLPLRPFQILPNNDSVILNLGLGLGTCFVPESSWITKNTNLCFEPLDYPIDLVMGIFSGHSGELLNDFYQEMERSGDE